MTSYTDNIKVKISEKYKPPPRINLAVSYAQRLKYNKQIENNIANYDFATEKSILAKVKAWRENKYAVVKDRQSNLEIKRQKLEEARKKALEELKSKLESEMVLADDFINSASMTTVPTNVSEANETFTTPNSNILIPTQASDNYCNILKPIPLGNTEKQLKPREADKQMAFNFSDFENDTSSPFDNMELKSINDLEELAQVLNQEENDQRLKNKTTSYLHSNVHNVQTDLSQLSQFAYKDYLQGTYSGNQYLSNIPNTASYRQNMGNINQYNGYQYPTDFLQYNHYNSPYDWTKVGKGYTSTFQSSEVDLKISNCKSVPDITNALEVELENSHISDMNPIKTNANKVQDVLTKNKEAGFTKNHSKEENCLNLLSQDEQEMCKSISIMGFPIERVARVYRLLGNDEKRVCIEYERIN